MPTHFKGTPKEKRALDALIKLQRAAESVNTRFMRSGALCELSYSQFAVIECLHHLGPMIQNEIGTKLLRSTGNITLVLDNLEKQELVQRMRNLENRRSITVSLTPKGKKVIESIFPKHLAVIVEAMNVLTAKEQETLAELCKKLGKGQSA